MVGCDLHDGRVKQRDGRVRGCCEPIGNLGFRQQSLDVVIRAVVQRTVDLCKSADILLFIDQIVPGLISESARPTQFHPAKFLTSAIVDIRSPDSWCPKREDAGIPNARPSPALPTAVPWQQQIVSFFGRQLLLTAPFCRNHGMGIAEFATPYCAKIRIASACEIIVGCRDLKALKIGAGQKIGNASHSIRSVDRPRAFLEHLDAINGYRRHGIYIYEAPPNQARWHIDLTPAIEQHKGARCTKPAQIHIGDALWKRSGLTGIVPTVSLADHPVAGTQILEKIHRLRRPLFCHLFPPNYGNRIGQTDG